MLGGNRMVAGLCAIRHNNGVANWLAQGFFPARYFKVMTDELAREGCIAPPELWGQFVVPKRPKTPKAPKIPNRASA